MTKRIHSVSYCCTPNVRTVWHTGITSILSVLHEIFKGFMERDSGMMAKWKYKEEKWIVVIWVEG
jgi:hypothetical protein